MDHTQHDHPCAYHHSITYHQWQHHELEKMRKYVCRAVALCDKRKHTLTQPSPLEDVIVMIVISRSTEYPPFTRHSMRINPYNTLEVLMTS